VRLVLEAGQLIDEGRDAREKFGSWKKFRTQYVTDNIDDDIESILQLRVLHPKLIEVA
jgi:hypothetical protein